MTFYGRAEELGALETAYELPGHDVHVVYGRRRVGKTELIKEFCADRSHIYFLAAQEAEHRQRDSDCCNSLPERPPAVRRSHR